MARRKLTQDEISSALENLPDWQLIDGKLQKTFVFDSFAKAVAWMVGVAIHADRLDHHPDWSNSYNRVGVQLITHDLNAISSLDVTLARHMEELS
jgi:4a-hydroxytetrahydrobiopterin dehydratase